jgi:hypothetical protein
MSDTITDPIPFFEHWKGLPHQRAAARQFWENVPESLKRRDSNWYQTWDGEQERPRFGNPLQVRYFSQRDSETPRQGNRMCFSSSCAMLLEFLKPGTLQGPNGDDTYLGRVFRYGDTTDAEAQLKALAYFGIRARLIKDAGWATLEGQINNGIPVPIGYIHKGPVSRPRGDGHWSTAIGHTPDAIIVHDPFGELDLVNGTYINSWGARLSYSRKNLGQRWMVEPIGDGTYRYAPGHGWAIIANP